MLIIRDRSILLSLLTRRPKRKTELAVLLEQKYWLSGDQVSVGIKCQKEVFTQSFMGGALRNNMDICSGSFQTAAAYAGLQAG